MMSDDRKWWKTRNARIAFLVGCATVAIGTPVWLIRFFPYVSTNDARVAAAMIGVAPQRQSGRIVAVHVNEGDVVKKGDLLLEMEHTVAEAGVLNAKARYAYASSELKRYTRGVSLRVAVQHDLDLMRRDSDVAEAEFQIANANLDDTYLKSPIDGIVIKRIAEVGNVLEPRQTAVILANIQEAWIAANVEETSINTIRKGQPVKIHVDEGYDLEGSVDEVIRSTASQFALIPSDNASGNYTKVVQRIPVRIAITSGRRELLRVGESAEVRIRVH